MPEPDYKIGQLIKHKLFNYRGVILKVDDSFKSSEEWYNTVAKSKPPKDKPWYTVLVHNAMHTTYVSERNLDMDDSNGEVIHPMVPIYFTTLNDWVRTFLTLFYPVAWYFFITNNKEKEVIKSLVM